MALDASFRRGFMTWDTSGAYKINHPLLLLGPCKKYLIFSSNLFSTSLTKLFTESYSATLILLLCWLWQQELDCITPKYNCCQCPMMTEKKRFWSCLNMFGLRILVSRGLNQFWLLSQTELWKKKVFTFFQSPSRLIPIGGPFCQAQHLR